MGGGGSCPIITGGVDGLIATTQQTPPMIRSRSTPPPTPAAIPMMVPVDRPRVTN